MGGNGNFRFHREKYVEYILRQGPSESVLVSVMAFAYCKPQRL